jgi:O-antigen biosynthesis protein
MEFTGERVVEGKTPERIWRDHLARYQFAAHYARGKTVLDISCGTGYGSQVLLKGGAQSVTGVDLSPETVAEASSAYASEKAHFHVGDILQMEFPNNHFDLIACFETIEHVGEQECAFQELRRVLKEGGQLIISTPNRIVTSPFRSREDPPVNPFHKIEYTTDEFVNTLGNYFHVEGLYGQRPVQQLFFLPVVERMARRLLPFFYNPARGDPELVEIAPGQEYRYLTAICKKTVRTTA